MDKYDEAIKYLTEHPWDIHTAWCFPEETRPDRMSDAERAHCLFQPVGDPHKRCGCLTQIRGSESFARTTARIVGDGLVEAIVNDTRIPQSDKQGGWDPFRAPEVSDLPVFAEWQRRLDKELGR